MENYSESGGEVRSSFGMSIGTRALIPRSVAQTWIVAGVNDPLEIVARETGFRDRRHMREAFVRGFGVPPQVLRRDARPPRQGQRAD